MKIHLGVLSLKGDNSKNSVKTVSTVDMARYLEQLH